MAQHEFSSKRAEYDAYSQQLKLQSVEKEGAEARKTLESQQQYQQRNNEHKDQLERKRMGDQLNAQKQMQEQALQKQQEQVERAEAARRKTLEYEAKVSKRSSFQPTLYSLHYSTLQYITVHYSTVHYSTVHYINSPNLPILSCA